MIDWTPKRTGATKGKRTVTHYGHPNCKHDASQRAARLIDGVMVVTCVNCGMEQRFETVKTAGFPRQTRK